MTDEPQPPAAMTRDEAERAVAELAAALAAVSEKVLAVEDHKGHQYLREHVVTGRTQEVWRSLQPRVNVIWALYSTAKDSLDELQGPRRRRRDRGGQHRLVELTRLLRDDVVSLRSDGMPVESATEPVAERLSVAALLDRLDATCADVLVTLAAVDDAVHGAADRLSEPADRLRQVRAAAATLELPQDSDLAIDVATMAADLSALVTQAAADPLGAADTDGPTAAALAGLAGRVGAAQRSMDGLTEVRAEHPERLAALRLLVESVAAAEEGVLAAHGTVAVKIAGADLAAHLPRLAELAIGLAAVERHGRAHRWQQVADELPAVERAATQALADAVRRTEQARALLLRRDELRGRFDSYRVKADRIGIGERAELTAAYREAWDLLWTAPCDLRAATAAVRRYQTLVAEGGARS
jgi:DNA-binding FrmR family transcriptional regulator